MLNSDLSLDGLLTILTDLKEPTFLGAQLVTRSAQGLAIERSEVVTAMTELFQYQRSCADFAARIGDLPATPAAVDLPEYNL